MNNENISTSLAIAINDHCREFEQSAEFSEMIHKHVKALYEKTIEDTFRWGKFPDAVKKALEDALPANLSEMVDLPKYNLLLARALDEQWQTNATSERLVSQMQELVKDFIEQDKTPKYILASDLWRAYVEQYQDEASHEGWERPLVVINTEDRHAKFFQIGFEKENTSASSTRFGRSTKTEYYECEVYLGFRRKESRNGRDSSPLQHEGHEVYSLYTGKLEYSDALGKKPVSFHSRFEKLVGAMYYGDSLLVLDESDPDEIYYPDAY